MAKALVKVGDKVMATGGKLLVKETYTPLKPILDATKSAQHLFTRYQGKNAEHLIKYDDTENVENFDGAFYMCENLTEIPNINTSNGTQYFQTFQGCKSVKKAPPVNTNKTKKINYMFFGCETIPKIDISHFSIESASNSGDFVSSCYKLKALIIRSFGEKYVLSKYAYSYCYIMLGEYHSIHNPNTEQGYVYVPQAMIETLQSATNWSAMHFRALEDYTSDGTCWGEFNDAKAGIYYD